MCEDLIERLLTDADLIHDNGITRKLPRHRVAALLREAAAALEAAREDGERWRQAFVDERASRYRAGGMKIEQARIHAEKDAEVAAIDQERGKGEP